MVFCYQNCVRENCSSDGEKPLKFEAEGRGFSKIFEITRTIYHETVKGQNNFW